MIQVLEYTFKHISTPAREQWLTFADLLSLVLRVFRQFFHRESWRWNEINQAIVQMSIGSLPIIIICTAFAGLLVTNEIAWHMDVALHAVTMTPGITGQFILRELGVVIPAMQLIAKVGASITAEVGTMKVTEQLDALKLLGIDPFFYLVMPRFIAALLSGACITLIAIAITLLIAMVSADYKYNISIMEYVNALRHFVGTKDILCAFVKGTIYCGVIPLISCTYGFRCKGGAEGVGTATTNSVVASTIAIIVLDFILTYFFTQIL